MTDSQMIATMLKKRMELGRHVHHQNCIHNLTPEEQVEARGKTLDWWREVIGSLPVQITSDEWETDPPGLEADYIDD